MSYGLAFANKFRLAVLCRRGYFAVMDSTHKTNNLAWFLFNLMIRDEHGEWVPGAHILTSHQDSDIVAAGLREVSIAY